MAPRRAETASSCRRGRAPTARPYHPPVERTPLPAVLYARGGGFMIGRSEDTDFLTRKIAALTGACVVSPNYRLAPEWPYPHGLDDYVAVYRWLRDHGDEIGVDRRWVATADDSSGSNFAAVTPVRALEEGVAPPDAVVMLGPVVDFRFEGYESFRRQAPRASCTTPPSSASSAGRTSTRVTCSTTSG